MVTIHNVVIFKYIFYVIFNIIQFIIHLNKPKDVVNKPQTFKKIRKLNKKIPKILYLKWFTKWFM
jgi:hypothetical protein